MKKALSVFVLLFSIFFLASCSSDDRVDTFFSADELDRYGLASLPDIDAESGVISNTLFGVTGYFNSSSLDEESYRNELLSFFEKSGFQYGALIKDSVENFKGLKYGGDFMRLENPYFYSDGSSFEIYYQYGDEVFRLRFSVGRITHGDKAYGYAISLTSNQSAEYSDDSYVEIKVNDDNYREYIDANVVFKDYTDINGGKYLYLEVIDKFTCADLTYEIKYEINGATKSETQSMKFNDALNGYHDFIKFFDVPENYKEGYLKVLDVTLKEPGYIVIPKH